MEKEKIGITILDVQLGISVAVCFAIATVLSKVGAVLIVGEGSNTRVLEVFQTMTSCIACMLCMQDNTTISKKAGVNRLIITLVGGCVGIGVILIDNFLQSKSVMTLMMGVGIIITLLLCKCCKVPYINARIGGVTFVLVTCTLTGTGRIWYALFRLLSTFGGILVTLLISWLFGYLKRDVKV